MSVEDGKQFLHSKITLSHLVAPVVEKVEYDSCVLLDMALSGVQVVDGPASKKLRCDLLNMCLVPPVEEVGVVP